MGVLYSFRRFIFQFLTAALKDAHNIDTNAAGTPRTREEKFDQLAF